jgi:uncharacterized protein with PIN domain
MPRPDCEICGISFDSRDHLQEHMEDHLDDVRVEDKLFDCTNCRRSFLNIEHYEQHNRMVHRPPSDIR